MLAKPRNVPDFLLGIAFASLGVLVLFQAKAVPDLPGLLIGPGLFPMVTGLGIVLFGLILAAQGYSLDADSQALALPGDDEIASSGTEAEQPKLLNGFVLGIIAALVGVIVLMPVLGFILAGVAFSVVIVLLSGGSWLRALIFSPIATLVAYAIFSFGLRVPLPRGLIG